jgi:transcription-repair coupling factor (superfamily II helicase)
MQLTGLVDLFREHSSYRQALRAVREHAGGDLGILRSARPFVLSALTRDWSGPVIYLTARIDRAYNVSEQIPAWLGPDAPVCRFAEPTPLYYERGPWGENIIRARMETLAALMPPDDTDATPTPPIVVASARSLMSRTLPVNQFRKATQVLKVGQRWQVDKLIDRWLKLGYEPSQMVIEPGTFSRRGGILDIYPIVADAPLRIEFFDDEIDSLRHFDPSTQRSSNKVDHAVILPAHEALPEATPPLAQHLAPYFAALPSTQADMTSPKADQPDLENGTAFPFLEFYLPYIYPNPVTLLDYAPDDALIVVDDWAELRDTALNIQEASEKTRAERIANGLLPSDYPTPYLPWQDLVNAFEGRFTLHLGMSEGSDDASPGVEPFRGLFGPENRFGGQLKPMLSELRNQSNTGDRIVVVTTQAARLTELWAEQDAAYVPRSQHVMEPPPRHTLLFVEGALREGWRLRQGDGELHLYTDAEIFGWNRPEPRRRKTARRARAPEAQYADLNEGDYVVHMDYGVGRFGGIRRRTLNDVEREYLMVEYAGTDTLFVPIHQADRLTRYVGPDETPPTLSKLGQADWIKIKSKAKQAVEDEARELLAIYAERANAERPRYAPDSPWQHELEASFPYVETEDQLKAVRAVKDDMESPHPMDRLICGDVGYGKTEVALRAAFKAVMDGKQVAVLVPTTILAEQHYETFSQRLAPFPIQVASLSRFRTKQEQSRILTKLAAGEVDIIVGTHRLLSKDVTMKNPGLVIIDEEQRFGVKHKEHFKKLRAQVDVLTLTATPIPRTMYMSLAGVRDISMIQTPPEERLPVITHVGPLDDRLIRQAVLRELERGGQVYYVYNRVNGIDNVRERLEEIVPEAKTVVGHGQMDNTTLENVMDAFERGEYDILVSTSIVESGLDIPNANTLIIERADLLGLAQMYQLRGRVGRSAQQAYAYFFHSQRMTEETRGRMETLSEYTDLGAGYQIAMRDLELRGAGDILSTRQTGHVAAIGLHLYTQMLANAVSNLKGSKSADTGPSISESGVLIDIPVPAYLPADYVTDISQRLQIYRRVGGLTSRDEVESMRDELRDRFGPMPPAVEGLLYQMDVKLLAQSAGATAVLTRDPLLDIRLPYLVEMDRDRLELLLRQRVGSDHVRVTRTAVQLPLFEDWQQALLDVLGHLATQYEQSRRLATGV